MSLGQTSTNCLPLFSVYSCQASLTYCRGDGHIMFSPKTSFLRILTIEKKSCACRFFNFREDNSDHPANFFNFNIYRAQLCFGLNVRVCQILQLHVTLFGRGGLGHGSYVCGCFHASSVLRTRKLRLRTLLQADRGMEVNRSHSSNDLDFGTQPCLDPGPGTYCENTLM